jgi:hypothetical protein
VNGAVFWIVRERILSRSVRKGGLFITAKQVLSVSVESHSCAKDAQDGAPAFSWYPAFD